MIEDIIRSISSHEDEGIMLPVPKILRVQQLDADSSCYAIAKPEIPFNTNANRMFNYLNGLRGRAACDFTNLHTTMHLKGGRDQVARYQPYQGKRQNGAEEYMNRVKELRFALMKFEAPWLKPCPQFFVEADDSMTIFQRQRIEETGDLYSSVISTNDKDLNSSLGVVQNINSGLFSIAGKYTADSGWSDYYGKTTYDERHKKLVGRGTSFFWHQMIAGDPVDYIKGCPLIMPEILNICDPIRKPHGRKPKTVAYGSVCKYLIGITTDVAAARRVHMIYKQYSATFGVPELFEETAILLWMQRNPNPYDVYEYLNGVCGLNITPHPRIVERVMEYSVAVAQSKIDWAHKL